MERVTWEQKPQLRGPTLICSFKGWNDAAESASSALRFLAGQWEAKRIGAIDPEEFFDFQVSRPTVKLTGTGGAAGDNAHATLHVISGKPSPALFAATTASVCSNPITPA